MRRCWRRCQWLEQFSHALVLSFSPHHHRPQYSIFNSNTTRRLGQVPTLRRKYVRSFIFKFLYLVNNKNANLKKTYQEHSRDQRCPNSTESLNDSATYPLRGSPFQCFTVLTALPSHKHNLTTLLHSILTNLLPMVIITISRLDATLSIAAGLFYRSWPKKPTSADDYHTALTF